MPSTIYDVRMQYKVRDQSSAPMRRMQRNADRTAKSIGALDKAVRHLGTVTFAAFAGRQAARALIGFNSQLEQARIQIAGMLAQASKGKTSFQEGFGTATTLVKDFQEIAKASVGTTKDFVDMASMIVRPITAAGLGMKDLKTFTKGAVIASRAFGIAADVAARDIEAALMGQLRSVDRFARALLEPIIGAGAEGRKAFNELAEGQRAAIVKAALGSDVIKAMARAQEFSFAGVTSTLKDNLQITFGKVGLPLMKALTNEIKQWNKWLDANATVVERWAKDLGSTLKDAFGFLKSVVGFMVEHKDTLMSIAKAWLAIKVSGALGGAIGGAFGGVGGFVTGQGRRAQSLGRGMLGRDMDRAGVKVASFGGSMLNAGEKMARFVPAVQAAGTALAAMTLAIKAAEAHFNERKEREIRERNRLVTPFSGRGIRGGAITHEEISFLRGGGTMTPDQRRRFGRIFEAVKAQPELRKLLPETDPAQLRARLEEVALRARNIDPRGITPAALATFEGGQFAKEVDQMIRAMHLARILWTQKAIPELFTETRKSLAQAVSQTAKGLGGFFDALRGQQPEVKKTDPMAAIMEELDALKGKGKVNITIERIEVKSQDPDRFVFGLTSAFADAAKNPSGAVARFREG